MMRTDKFALEGSDMRQSETQKSRRATPWDGETVLTPTQVFLKENYEERYNIHHRKVGESGEAEMINSYPPSKCPFCDSAKFKKNGYTDSGVRIAAYNATNAPAIKHSYPQQEPSLMTTNCQSENGWNTA